MSIVYCVKSAALLWQVWQLDEAPFGSGMWFAGSCPRRQSSA